MVLATAVTGVTRVVADRHYASDVVVGAGIGFGVGYGLPWLLHYRAGGQALDASHVFLVPFGGSRSVGVGIAGAL